MQFSTGECGDDSPRSIFFRIDSPSCGARSACRGGDGKQCSVSRNDLLRSPYRDVNVGVIGRLNEIVVGI